MNIQDRAHDNGVGILQQARLDEMRRAARRLRIADEADYLLGVYHQEIEEREPDGLPF